VSALERVRAANRPGPPEHSVLLRVAAAGSVAVGVAACAAEGELSLLTAGLSIAAVLAGSIFSYRRREHPLPWLKVVLALVALGAFWRFFLAISGANGVPNLGAVEGPLAVLFTWIQVTHAFDVPTRRDLVFSLAGSATLMAVAGAQALDMSFGLYVVGWVACLLLGLGALWGSVSGTGRLPAGALVAVAFSLVVGFPTLRLRGPYFALAMLAAATIMQRLTRIFWQYTGGEEGIPGLDPLFDDALATYYFCLAALVVTTAVLLALARSSWGTILRAIRGDEAACQAAGINVTFYKIVSLMISAAFAGLGGALYADYQEAVTPDVFAVALSITIIIMVYVGGMGTIYGPVLGAILLALLPELLRGLGEYRLWVYSIILMFILFFSPGGLVAPLWRRIRGTP